MKRIRFVILFTFFIITGLFAETVKWGVPIMPVSEIKPGMTGTGYTVFYGNEIEEFGFKVIEIVENFYPKRDLVLVELTGEKARKNGVVSGMSGSPTYIDGKLVGALALRFGMFMKDPIGGIMPIEQMTEIDQHESARAQETTASAALLPDYIATALCGADDSFWQHVTSGFEQTLPQMGGNSLTQIKSPLVFSGFDSRLVSQFSPQFESLGFNVASGGTAGSTKTDDTPLAPGSAVAQIFINGDMGIESTGTVTTVQDNKVLAFGHYVFNLGPVNLPMAKAKILATLPSEMGSTKMAASTEIVGAFRQDRLTGVYGDMNITPRTIPIDLNFEQLSGTKTDYHFNMADDPAMNNIMPLFLRIALIQSLTAGRLSGSLNSMYMNSTIEFTDGTHLKLNDFFSTRQRFGFMASGTDANSASDLIASALGALMVNDFESPNIKSININTREVAGERIARIKNIWQNKNIVSPGDTLTFSIELETTKNKDLKIQRSFPIPKNLDARSLTILISSGPTLSNYEIQTNRNKFIPVDFAHMVSIIENRRMNDHLYLQIQMQDKGLMLEGEELTALPPSVMDIMSTIKTNGSSQNTGNRILHEESIQTDYVIAGAKRLVVTIKQPPKATYPDPDEEQPAQPTYW